MSQTGHPSLPDYAVRRQAIMAPHHAFVWASAGTGKTHTLILRALYLLLNAPFVLRPGDPAGQPARETELLYRGESRSLRIRGARAATRALVLTTFTRKAAAEMQTRLYRYLESIASARDLPQLRLRYENPPAGNPDPLCLEIVENTLQNLKTGWGRPMPLFEGPQGEDSFQRLRRGAQALSEVATELQISTLHSLAASVLRRHPLAAGIPPTAHFAREDEEDLSDLEDQMVDRWWQQVVLTDAQIQRQLERLLAVVSVRQIRQWLRWCHQFRWLAEEARRVPLQSSTEAKELLDALQALLQILGAGASGRRKQKWRSLLPPLNRLQAGQADAWPELCRVIGTLRATLFLDGKPNRLVRAAIDRLPAGQASRFASGTDFCVSAARLSVGHQFGELWSVWTDFLSRFLAWAEEAAVQELGLVSFDEMIERAATLLEQHPAVRRMEQQRLRAILVDELQDTDPGQLRLLQALLQRDEGGEAEVLGFFVGDLKQSIYRFRRADVASIRDFHRHYETRTGCRTPCRDYHLRTSFRSLPPLIRFVNHFFEHAIELAGEEEQLQPVRPEGGDRPAWICIDVDEAGRPFYTEGARRCAAGLTLRLIRDYLNEEATRRYRDVLILVRYAKEVDALLPVLRRAGIPAVSSGARTFYRHPEILDLLNLFIVLFHPQDRLAVASILRSPFVFLADIDLHALLDQIPPEQVFHSGAVLPEWLAPEPRRQIEAIRTLAGERINMPLRDWLGKLRRLIPAPLYSEPRDHEGRPQVRVDRLLRAFQEQLEATRVAPLVWLLKQRERAARVDRWDGDLGEDVNVADESVDAVRVMTIHKAKGLEAPFVIAYGWTSVLTDLVRERSSPVIELTTGTGDPLRAFSLEWGPLTVGSPDWSRALEEERRAEREEARRLAYVTATRARDRMVLLCPVPQRCSLPEEMKAFLETGRQAAAAAPDRKEAPVCGGTLRFLHLPGMAAERGIFREPAPKWDAQEYRTLWERRYREFRSAAFPLIGRPSDPEHRQEEDLTEGPAIRPAGGPPAPRLVGRLVHAYLERHLRDPALEPEKLRTFVSQMPELRQWPEALRRAGSILSRFYEGELRDGQGRSYRERLDKGLILGREVPVFLRQDQQAWHGVIDLIYRRGEILWAIDYKTTASREPLPESYRAQERVYSAALRRLFPREKVQFEFWWLGQ